MHLFDPRRPGGVPWPEKTDVALYKPALPARYRSITKDLGIVGAIEVEASPRLEDNQWVLDTAAVDKIIVGTVGDLEPGQPEFGKQLDRFHRNPLFRGIRYGNIWDRNLGEKVSHPEFVSDLRVLADAGMVLDTANPDAELVDAVVKVTDRVPKLRVVIDHLPQITPPGDETGRRRLEANLKLLSQRPQVYVKVSEVLRRVDGKVSLVMSSYRDRLDEMWELFGPDRVLYGSDWPNSDHWGTPSQELHIVRQYFLGKGRAAAEKYFWKNSIAAYHWVKRDKSQPELVLG